MNTRVGAPRLLSFELLRGLAAFSVVLHHATLALRETPALGFDGFHGGWVFPGDPGVEFFFVLSGFVMVLSHAQDAGSLRGLARFAWRRVCRIYPSYWLVMAMILSWAWRIPWVTAPRVLDWLTLLPGLHRVLDPMSNLLAVAWTLRVEIGFYMIFALCLLPRIGRLILPVWVTTVIVQTWWPTTLPRLGVPVLAIDLVNPFCIEFLCGMAAATVWRRHRAGRIGALGALGLGCVLIALYVHQTNGGYGFATAWTRPTAGAGVGLVLLGLGWLEQQGALRLGRFAAFCGMLSYPLYVSHLVAFDHLKGWLPELLKPNPAAWLSDGATVAIFAAGSLLFAVVIAWGFDRPVQALLRGRRPSLRLGLAG